MNLNMFRRVVDRHRHMQEFAPYREFLQHVASQPDLWRVTQADFASWWKSRENSRLQLSFSGSGHVLISTDLDGAVLALDDQDLRALPTEIPCAEGASLPHLSVPTSQVELTRAMLAHLGQAHVRLDAGQEALTDTFCELLEAYTSPGVLEARAYPVEVVRALREAVAAAHFRAGLPVLRIWSLRHDESGAPYRVAFSPRFDVDKAMVNVAMISELHAEYGVHGTFYLRPMGVFYGRPEIQRWCPHVLEDELALHGEFVTTAEQKFGDEWKAAIGEKQILEEMIGREVVGICSHGGELRTNQTPNTPSATDGAGFAYETTFYPRPYYLPMYLPCPDGIRPTLTILRHQDDVSLPLDAGFGKTMVETFSKQLNEARTMGGVFVPTMHPLYFDLKNYLSYASSWARLAAFSPVFVARAARMKRGQLWSNQSKTRPRA